MRGHHDINEMNYDNTDTHFPILQGLEHVAKLVHILRGYLTETAQSSHVCEDNDI